MKTARELKDLPTSEYYLVLIAESTTYDDGYGSHGSPSMSTHRYLEHNIFMDVDDLKSWIIKNDESSYKKSYKVFKVAPCAVNKQVSIDVSIV